MKERKNPNPLCPICDRPTKAFDVGGFSNGRRPYSHWEVRCGNMKTCGGREDTLYGHGETVKDARADFQLHADKFRQDKAGAA